MWWPFRRQPAPASVYERLEACESTCRRLGTALKELDAEWEIVYRKMHNALSSLNMKQRADEKRAQAGEVAPGPTNGHELTLMDVRGARRVLPGR